MDAASDKIERGIQAKALLESAVFSEAVNRLLQHYVDCWMAGKTVEAREDAHRYVTLLQMLKGDLQSAATTGTLTRKRIDALQGQPQTTWRAFSG